MHHNVKDRTGQRFGRWVVLKYVGSSYWQCRCDCGTVRDVFTGNFGKNKSTSCGCFRSEWTTNAKTTHGLYGTPEYKTWAGIKRRCRNPNDECYSRYGAAGVTMCGRWADSFEAFIADMGEKPTPAHTIDRIDNSRGYEPSNCRWATTAEQNRNKRNNVLLAYNGVTKTLAEWAREFNLHHSLLQYRLSHGWSLERALTKRPQ